MLRLRGRALALGAAAVATTIVLAGCTSQTGPASGATTSTTPTPTQTVVDDTGLLTFNPCLLSVKQVGKAIAGKWKIDSRTTTTCTYKSNRGAAFATSLVPAAKPKAGLTAAKATCDTKPSKVTATHSFACVERNPGGDLVVGNVVAKGQLWQVAIVPSSSSPYRFELKAMKAILAQVRT